MGDYPVPSVSWKSDYHKPSQVHFRWEFGVGDTACSKRIPMGAQVNYVEDREITCRECLYQVYDIPRKMQQKSILSVKNVKSNYELVKLIFAEIEEFKTSHGKYAAKKRVSRELNITLSFLNDILRGRAPVTQKIAKYFGYTRVIGFVKNESQRHQ